MHLKPLTWEIVDEAVDFRICQQAIIGVALGGNDLIPFHVIANVVE